MGPKPLVQWCVGSSGAEGLAVHRAGKCQLSSANDFRVLAAEHLMVKGHKIGFGVWALLEFCFGSRRYFGGLLGVGNVLGLDQGVVMVDIEFDFPCSGNHH